MRFAKSQWRGYSTRIFFRPKKVTAPPLLPAFFCYRSLEKTRKISDSVQEDSRPYSQFRSRRRSFFLFSALVFFLGVSSFFKGTWDVFSSKSKFLPPFFQFSTSEEQEQIPVVAGGNQDGDLGQFSLQLGWFEDLLAAQSLKEALGAQNIQSSIRVVQVNGMSDQFLVYMRGYHSVAEAETAASVLQKQYGFSATVKESGVF